MFQHFTKVWDATVAFLVSNGPMVTLAIVAAVTIGVVLWLYISNLERQDEMRNSEDIGELAQAMWEEYQQQTALEVDASIVGVDCPACGMFLEEGHVCPDEYLLQQDCPLCPPDAGKSYKVEYDFFGEICRIDGVACCEMCYRVHHLTIPDEDELVPEAQQAMNAFHRMQAEKPTWQERQRQTDFERRAYCGWED